MSICYIILSCEKYIPTRAKFLLETSLKNVDPKHIYFLSCKTNEPNIYGWNTDDNYESCPLKYIRFFQNMTLDYDWYYFMDDDTFVFPDRLNKFVSNYNKEESLYIGCRCENYSFPIYMSGGAGFLLTKSLYTELIYFIRNTPENKLITSIYGDYLLGLWLTNINKKIIEVHIFNSQTHKDEYELNNCISFHYLKTKEQYDFYDKFL